MKIRPLLIATTAAALCVGVLLVVRGTTERPPSPAELARLDRIHAHASFIDMHAHPDRFHRDATRRVRRAEIARYRAGRFDLAVAAISSDAPWFGGYVAADGTQVEVARRTPAPIEAYRFTLERLSRLTATADGGDVRLVRTPSELDAARAAGAFALLPALEGADALEGDLERLRTLHRYGIGLVQLIHGRPNELGYSQNEGPDLGLTEFGREVIRECNRLGIVIDLAHASHRSLLDALATSKAPVIVSHTAAAARHPAQPIAWLDDPLRHRLLSDDELRAVATADGVIGIWLYGGTAATFAEWADEIAHVANVAGIDHVGVGTDLRGLPDYTADFDRRPEFSRLGTALLRRGFTDAESAKILGGNFRRVWSRVAAAR
jgi:membrane dipeptidase